MGSFALTRHVSIPIAHRPGSSRLVWLGCQLGTALYFDLYDLPKPSGWGGDGSGQTSAGASGRLHRRRTIGQRFEIVHTTDPTAGVQDRTEFRLGSGYTLQTLQVIADHLESIGALWLYLADSKGAQLKGASFNRRSPISQGP